MWQNNLMDQTTGCITMVCAIRQRVKASNLASEVFAPPNSIFQRLVVDVFRVFEL